MRNSVKHILIILSFLLLSSPVIGNNHKGETLYRWDTSSGYVWKEFGEKDTNPKYKGDVENGKPNGLGYLIYPNGGKYVGGWKDGIRIGQGTETDKDGRKYVGEWKDGERNGQGTYTWSDGNKYVGEFKGGLQNGQGTFTFSDGREYLGEFKDGNLWKGTMYIEGYLIGKYVDGKRINQ